MKQKIKAVLNWILRPIIIRLGYTHTSQIQKPIKGHLQTHKKDFLLHNFFETLKKVGFKPTHIIDVGANRGTWTRLMLKDFPDAKYTLLEPQYWLAKYIKDITDINPNINFYPVGAGKANGTFKMTTHDRDDSFSFRHTEEDATRLGREQFEVEVVTLNSFIEKQKLSKPDIIKIDAEGIDIDVLEGADNFFGITEVFMVEAAVMNKQMPNTVKKVIDYMDNKNYRLFDITDLNRTQKHGALWLVELVFVYKNGFLDKAIKSYA